MQQMNPSVNERAHELVKELLFKPRKLAETEFKALLKRMEESPHYAYLEKKSIVSDTSFHFIKTNIDVLCQLNDDYLKSLADLISRGNRFLG